MSDQTSVKVIIDRIEEDLAVIVLYDDDSVKFNLPSKYLPEGTHDGDHLKITFAVDRASHDTVKHRIDDLLNSLKEKKD